MINDIQFILDNYLKSHGYSKKEAVYQPIIKNLPAKISAILSSNGFSNHLKCKGSFGQTNRAFIPCISIYDDRLTQTIQKGMYVTYLFRKDMTGFYLVLAQGSTYLDKIKGTNRKFLEDVTDYLIDSVPPNSFSSNDIYLGDGDKAESYRKTTLYQKYYPNDGRLNEKQIEEDLVDMVNLYNDTLTKLDQRNGYYQVVNDFLAAYNPATYIKKHVGATTLGGTFTMPDDGYNKIYYGIPGCGKSHKIEEIRLTSKTPIADEDFFRVTFYEDYSYSDFIGQLKPVPVPGGLEYKFEPGPFVLALKRAIDNPEKTIYLVIEEINRGNAPSIFGDFFQTLDRYGNPSDPKFGISEYPITNKDVQEYLATKNKIGLPRNLIILATMNTSDQNVFTLDTAFKRRWEFEEIINKHYATGFVPGTDVTWEKFCTAINKRIIELQSTKSAMEDKRMGGHFVKERELSQIPNDTDDKVAKRFAYKVLEYLWDDVVKFQPDQLFDSRFLTLSDLIDAFVNSSRLGIFNSQIVF